MALEQLVGYEELSLLYEANTSATQRKRLHELMSSGATVEQIFKGHVNERGEVKYTGIDDPNHLSERFGGRLVKCLDLSQKGFIPPEVAHQPINECYDPLFFTPSAHSVSITRELEARAEGLPIPTLETHQDYVRYFKSFPNEVLVSLFENLGHMGLTRGCEASCNTMCAVGVEKKITHHMPFETLEWIVQFMNINIIRNSAVALYYDSDLKFYQSRDKSGNPVNGVDAILKFEERRFKGFPDARREFNERIEAANLVLQCVSISFGLDDATVNFIVDALLRNVPIHRISRLNSGLDTASFDKLLERVKNLYELKNDNQKSLSDEQIQHLKEAFTRGKKDRLKGGLRLGEAVKSSTSEHKIGVAQPACIHGVVFRAGRGFFATIARPASKAFPNNAQEFPIGPNRMGSYLVPKYQHISDHQFINTMADGKPKLGNRKTIMIFGPEFIEWKRNYLREYHAHDSLLGRENKLTRTRVVSNLKDLNLMGAHIEKIKMEFHEKMTPSRTIIHNSLETVLNCFYDIASNPYQCASAYKKVGEEWEDYFYELDRSIFQKSWDLFNEIIEILYTHPYSVVWETNREQIMPLYEAVKKSSDPNEFYKHLQTYATACCRIIDMAKDEAGE